MNWIKLIEKAVAYIEAHLQDELTVDDVARAVFVSPAHFQKAFSLLCGYTVGEYIRNRRLSEAGRELLSCDYSITEIALRYGYDSTDSFSRAFTRFHGATPSLVKRSGRTIKAFAPLKLNLLMKGGYIMDYRIVRKPTLGIRVKADLTKPSLTYLSDNQNFELPVFCLSSYLYNRLAKNTAPSTVNQTSPDSDGRLSLYVSDITTEEHPEEFIRMTAPATMWAVFCCKGTTFDEARNNTWQEIRDEWFPQTGYEIDSSFNIQINCISANDSEATCAVGEIWVPIKEKQNHSV